jgi:hypothetical protein
MKAGGKRASRASCTGDDLGYVSTHVVNMLESSASKGKARPLKQCWKRAWRSPFPKEALKPLEVAAVEGSFPWSICFFILGPYVTLSFT